MNEMKWKKQRSFVVSQSALPKETTTSNWFHIRSRRTKRSLANLRKLYERPMLLIPPCISAYAQFCQILSILFPSVWSCAGTWSTWIADPENNCTTFFPIDDALLRSKQIEPDEVVLNSWQLLSLPITNESGYNPMLLLLVQKGRTKSISLMMR